MRVRLLVSEAWRSLGANLSTTFAAMVTVLVGMFLLGLFIFLGTWTLSWSDHVKRELIVKIDFKTADNAGGQATRKQEMAVINKLNASPLVKDGGVKFVSKEKAIEIMKKREPELVAGLTSNPLPDVVEITPVSAEKIDELAGSLSKPLPAGVHSVHSGKKYSKRVLQFAHVIELIFTIATIILLVAATMLIANTIRLSIFARRREIEVMKLVGATNWFIRGPFMIEGLLTGLGGAALAVLCLVVGKEVALPALHLADLSKEPDVHALAFPVTSLILLMMGLALGALGSGITLRRFLQI
jgi:cell division transport system permease protein